VIFDWQQIVMALIVLAAAVAVGRRLWAQVAGFRSGSKGDACAGCPSAALSGSTSNPNSAKNAKTNSAPALVQIQTRPPLHLRRPKE